ncbi:MAG TPA: hypothetical protein VF455_03715, partial [Chryseobacterium sp.]
SLLNHQILKQNVMKNLKKLSKDQLKSISGAGGIKGLPEPDFCMYYCNGVVVCATCSKDFKCPDDSI